MSFAEHLSTPSNSIKEEYFYHLHQAAYYLKCAQDAGKEARICMIKFFEHRELALKNEAGET
jgi:hypothetical protein